MLCNEWIYSQTLSCSSGHNYPNLFSVQHQQKWACYMTFWLIICFLVFGYMNKGFGATIVRFCPDSINHSEAKSLLHKIFNATSLVYQPLLGHGVHVFWFFDLLYQAFSWSYSEIEITFHANKQIGCLFSFCKRQRLYLQTDRRSFRLVNKVLQMIEKKKDVDFACLKSFLSLF